MGTLTKKIQRQLSKSSKIAPIVGPTAAPRAADAPHIPITVECRDAGNSGKIIEREAGLKIEEPIPCRTRAAIKNPGVGAIPERNDPSIKTATPIRKNFLRPR